VANLGEVSVFDLRGSYRTLLCRLAQHREVEEFLGEVARSFRRLITSYCLDLFDCNEIPDLPRSKNDLEHFSGSAGYR